MTLPPRAPRIGRRTFLTSAALAAPVLALGSRPARAQSSTTLTLGTMWPAGSPVAGALGTWATQVAQRTSNALMIRIFPGATQGDERQMIAKLRSGTLDAIFASSAGLRAAAPSTAVLSAPGTCTSAAQLEAARAEVGPELVSALEAAGYKHLGWADLGLRRVFARRAIATPADMQATLMWKGDDDVWAQVLTAAGARSVDLRAPEVLPSLTTGAIDAFAATAHAALAYGWSARATHATSGVHGVSVGALLVKKARFDALPDALKRVLVETAGPMHATLTGAARSADDRALTSIRGRGVTLDAPSGGEAWEAVFRTARTAMTGPMYSAELLARVERAARAAR